MTPGPGIEPGPHWWEASALTTAPSLLPCSHFSGHRLLLHLQWPLITKVIEIPEKVYYMSLQTEITKSFLVSFQLLFFYGDLREGNYSENEICTQNWKSVSILAYFGHFDN